MVNRSKTRYYVQHSIYIYIYTHNKLIDRYILDIILQNDINHVSYKKDVVVCDNGTGFVKCGLLVKIFHAICFLMVGRPTLRAESAIGNIELRYNVW